MQLVLTSPDPGGNAPVNRENRCIVCGKWFPDRLYNSAECPNFETVCGAGPGIGGVCVLAWACPSCRETFSLNSPTQQALVLHVAFEILSNPEIAEVWDVRLAPENAYNPAYWTRHWKAAIEPGADDNLYAWRRAQKGLTD